MKREIPGPSVARPCVLLLGFLLSASAVLAQIPTDDCIDRRGGVRSGIIHGPTFDPTKPAGKLITIEDFRAIRCPRSTLDAKQRPSVIAKNARLGPAETTIYQFDNVEIVTFEGCGRTFLHINRVGNSSVSLPAFLPGAVCRSKSQYKEAFAKLEADYPALSVWKGNPSVANICGSAGEGTPPLRIFGLGFWDDNNGQSAPTLVLDPV